MITGLRLEDRIRAHARSIYDRVFTGRHGRCGFAKDVAADLPLLTLADVLGMPQQCSRMRSRNAGTVEPGLNGEPPVRTANRTLFTSSW